MRSSFKSLGSISLALACAFANTASAQPTQTAPEKAASDQRYAYCTVFGKDSRYYSPIFTGRPGDETDQKAFSAAIAAKYGDTTTTGLCSSRETEAAIIEVRDRRFAQDVPKAVMTSILPPGARVASIQGASTPRVDPPGDGSVGRPLILECTATSGQFSSMTQRYETALSTLVKIAGPTISIWKKSASTWIEHPCVRDTRNGQFCSITPTRIWIKDSYELTPGAEESNELDIDRVTAGFKFETLLATPKVAPFIQARQAGGSCLPAKEPDPATAPAPPRTAF